MDRLRTLIARLRGLLGRSAADRQLDEEIALHLELETRKNIQRGLSPAEAHRRARIAFGAIESMKETHRDGRGARWLEEFLADVRYALRALRRHPILGSAAIVTLAIGIGANTAIYSAVNAVILRPLPFADPGRLVMLWEENPEKGWHLNIAAPANYLDWKEQTTAFQDMAAYFPYANSFTMTGVGDPRVYISYSTTGNFFSVLGSRPELGRGFDSAETWATGHQVAIISHRLWQQQLGGARDVIGKTVQLSNRDYEVIGVMPASFRFPAADADIWTPTAWDPARRSQVSFRRAHSYRVIGRLKPGVSLVEANSQLQVVVNRLKHDYPVTNRFMGAGMTPLQEFLLGDTRQALLLLLASVALLLLIACANVGNLMLIQTAGRGREAALRLALGARRTRLLRQAFTESLVLSAIGGVAGLGLGWWGTRVLFALQPGMLPVQDINMNWSVLGYVVAITAGSGMLFGIAPVLWTNRRVPGEVLKDGGRSGGMGHRLRRWGHTLVVAEIALALVLTLGAGLLVRSFQKLQRVDPGFDPENVLTLALNLPGARYDDGAKMTSFFARLIAQVDAVPGVQSAATTTTLPLGGGVGWTSDFTAAGRAAEGFGVDVAHRAVSVDYLRTMRVPLRRGRLFTPGDDDRGERVVLINESLAHSYFHDEDPVGQRITFDRVPDSTSIWRTIVGVVGDERQTALATASKIEITTPDKQAPSPFVNLMIRTSVDPVTVVPAIRGVLAQLDPALAFISVQTMRNVREQSLARSRFLMTLLFCFAAAGLVLAVVGIYGVMAHVANGRTREMGIRIALGAQTRSVRWLVVREGVTLTALGIGVGVAGALVACRAMTALLFQVTPGDPVTFVVVPPLLATAALVATWLPAARASRADPMESLRTD